MTKRFYTPREVSDILQVSPTTVMDRIHAGVLPAVRVSERIYRIPVPALERFVSTEPVREFHVEYRQVDRVTHIGETLAADTERLIKA
jgi:excisionase family DNA binding protein